MAYIFDTGTRQKVDCNCNPNDPACTCSGGKKGVDGAVNVNINFDSNNMRYLNNYSPDMEYNPYMEQAPPVIQPYVIEPNVIQPQLVQPQMVQPQMMQPAVYQNQYYNAGYMEPEKEPVPEVPATQKPGILTSFISMFKRTPVENQLVYTNTPTPAKKIRTFFPEFV